MSSRSDTDTAGAAAFVPDRLSKTSLARGIDCCRGCELYRNATQGVAGAGPVKARVMLVGEQPGDQEDKVGAPFVGPAGKLLDRALAEAGIDRGDVWLTNAVKHFRFEERGARRIHTRPSRLHVRACRPWLDAELELVDPELVVLLGATAAGSLLGAGFRLTQHRGELLHATGLPPLIATVHPSSILRSRSSEERAASFSGLVRDLRRAAEALAEAAT